MDVVIRTAHGEAEITIARAGALTALADDRRAGDRQRVAADADIDGRPVLTTATIDDSGMITGSVIDSVRRLEPLRRTRCVELVQVAGWGAGARQALGPGIYRVGPGRRVNATDLEVAHVDKIAFEISIDSDGSANVTVDEQAVRIDGIGVEGSAPWTAGILDVGGRAFELDRTIGRTGPPRRDTAPARQPARSCSTARRDQRRLRHRRRSPSPDGLDVLGEPARAPRHERRQRGDTRAPTSTCTPRSAPSSWRGAAPSANGATTCSRTSREPSGWPVPRHRGCGRHVPTTTTRSSSRSASATSTGDRR